MFDYQFNEAINGVFRQEKSSAKKLNQSTVEKTPKAANNDGQLKISDMLRRKKSALNVPSTFAETLVDTSSDSSDNDSQDDS